LFIPKEPIVESIFLMIINMDTQGLAGIIEEVV
jgi:hypothetical protein